MRTRRLGKSNVEVGEIGLGTWSLSGEGYGPVDPATARVTIEAALDEGVTLIETAACYGPHGAIELLIGDVLKNRPKDRPPVFVTTRIGVDRDAPNGGRKRFDPASITKLAEDSLKRLQCEQVGAFLLHNPLAETTRDGRVFEALRSLKERGLAQLIGVSAGSVTVARDALDRGIDLIELPYSLLHPRMLHTLASDIAGSGTGVLARSTLSYGILADSFAADRKFAPADHRNDRWSPAEFARRIRQREAARFMVKGEIKSLREAAVRYVLSNNLVSCAVMGARTAEHARLNAHAADTLPYLPAEVMGQVAVRMSDEGVAF